MKYLLLILLLFSCVSAQKTTLFVEEKGQAFLIQEIKELKDTVYAGKVRFSYDFNDITFVSTDSINVTLYSQYDIPKGTKVYVVFRDSTLDRSTTTIIWDGNMDEHQIVRH